jgi:trimethylamine--corrinoid protein Co-methyltransferase
MAACGYQRGHRPLELLTSEQLECVHSGSLHVLQTTGVRFESKRALNLFADAGCSVDRSRSQVKFPSGLVEACLRQCPSGFTLRGRLLSNSLRFGGNTVYFYNSVGLRTIDLDTGKPRTPTMAEQDAGVRVLDALENLHLLNSYTPYMEIEGIAPRMVLLESLASRIRTSTKPTLAGYSNGSEVFAVELAKAAGVEVLGMVAASPPLTYYQEACDAAFRWVEAGFPIWLSSGGIAGGTAPATVAGSTVTNNAELMAGVVLVQLIRPSTPMLVADFVLPMNMRNGHPAFGSLGCALHACAFSQIWRRYGIPTVESLSGYPSSKRMDFQCGYEKAVTALASALAGINLVSMHGGVYGELTFHPVQAILDDDLAGLIGRFIEGVTVTADTLALDLIEAVGPIPGTYIDQAHTRRWWKEEQFMPRVADWTTYSDWIQSGGKGAVDCARERMRQILATHESVPLSDEQLRDMDRVLKQAREHLLQ